MKFHITPKCLSIVFLFFSTITLNAQDVTITIDATAGKKAVSPYIYGANNWFDKPYQFYKDAGLTMARTNGGNNATKYNWRKKISSHPDWYNNVYTNDWDKISQNAATNLPNVQIMWAFQLLGRVASNTNNNFNDWAFNKSQYWEGVGWDLAGGGVVDTTGGTKKLGKSGDMNLYTQEWPADSTVGILNHFFQPKPAGLGLNKKQFVYWNMDNEVDIWNGTHGDVMPTLIAASAFMDNYIVTAKKVRALFPEIKLCAPVATSEWQWFKWGSESIRVNGKYYSWLEYFIKRCADEEKASGVRVLDVVDLHNYAYAANDTAALQVHRMYYDQTYNYPGANGIYSINGGWDTRIKSEYIFKRINDWLTTYFGANSGITCGVSEWHAATDQKNANTTAVVYASHLGTFANNGVELFTPWSWYPGMWETLHLFSRYAKKFSVSSVSSLENTISAYTTVNEKADSMTVILVNRDMKASRTATINLNNFVVNDGNYSTLQLSSLPTTETFKSHTNNALKLNSVSVNSNSFTITLPSVSVTAVVLKSATTALNPLSNPQELMKIYPNPVDDKLNVSISSNNAETTEITLYDRSGRKLSVTNLSYDGFTPISIDTSTLIDGFYLLSMKNNSLLATKSFIVNRD